MENRIKPVEIDDNYAEILNIKEQYTFRFGYTRPKEDLIAFKNRTIAAIASNIYNELDLRFYTIKIFELLGYPYTGIRESVFDGSLLHQALRTVKIEEDKYILYIWFQILEVVANSIPRTDDGIRQYAFVQKIAIALKLSGVNAVICLDGDEYKFFPYSETFFDKPMVVDVINWLGTYEKAQKQYRRALNDMLKGKYDRQIVDTLRLALELFLKQFLGNNKSLENQTKDLGIYLKDKNISSEVSNMFFKLIDCYAKYNNSHAKHDDSVDENELDFLLYLTGSFIHFLIKIDKKNVIGADV